MLYFEMVHFTQSIVAAPHLLYASRVALVYFHVNQGDFNMIRAAYMVVLAAFLTAGFSVPMTFASEPAPAEEKEKKDTTGGKADDEKKTDEKNGMGGK
jgi:hypothetical protein